jgi:DNA repair exonuclease SbcCD ATPase subunit
MGFFDNLKKAFGLESNTDDELEVEGIDATVTPLRQRNQQSADRVATPSAGDSDADYRQATASVAAPSAIPTDKLSQPDPSVIFEQVIEVFNRALPDFLGQSVDPERERQALFKALDSSMKEYFENLEKNVERRLQLKYEVDRQRLHEQIEELQVKARKEEEGTSNAKNLQLSAERQKRALSERVHDLEKQVATLEAENEQYILENKSMANKLRMASMSDREVDEMRQAAAEQAEAAANAKVAEAEAKLAEMSTKAAEADAKVAEADAKVAAAEKRAAEAEQRAVDAEKQVAAAEELLHDAAQETEASANAAKQEATAQAGKVAELQAEIARMQTALEHAKAQDALGRAMVNDLNGKAAEARKLADERTTQIDTLKDELVATKEQLATTGQKLAKAQEDLKVVREVQIQVFQLEEKQKHTDATIRRQKDELMEKDELLRVKDADLLTKNTTLRVKDETIRRLEDQTDSLRKSIENIQYEKSQSESALLSEIERLKSLRGMSTATPTNYANIQVVNGATGVSEADAAPAASAANAAPQTAPQSQRNPQLLTVLPRSPACRLRNLLTTVPTLRWICPT